MHLYTTKITSTTYKASLNGIMMSKHCSNKYHRQNEKYKRKINDNYFGTICCC